MTHPTTKGDLESSVTQIMLMLRALDKDLQSIKAKQEEHDKDLQSIKAKS